LRRFHWWTHGCQLQGMSFSYWLFYLTNQIAIAIVTQLKSDGRCTTNDESSLLQKETETCESIDQQFHTHLPDWTM
jgi:hypothetical protein